MRKKQDFFFSLNKDSKQYLQPLALVLVCAVFISLILIIGIMDFRRIDNTLIGFMQNRGMDVIGNIQRVAQGNYTNLVQLFEGEHGNVTISPFSDDTFAPQDALIKALINLGRRIDQSWNTKLLEEKDKMEVSSREGLFYLAVFDPKGQIIFQNRPVSSAVLNKVGSVVAGKKDVAIELFDRSANPEKVGFVALRRNSGKGAILLALDEAGFQLWGAKVAIQRAIEEAGWGKGMAYISIMNSKGQLLGTAGDVNPSWTEGLAHDLLLRKDKPGVTHQKISFHGKDILEIIGPVLLDGQIAGIARIGLERDRMDEILRENRYNMFISMAAIMLIGVLSIWLLFYNQNRHLKRIEEMSKRLQQSERLSSLGQLAAGVAHEIRNPLNAISMASQRLQREYRPLLDAAKGEDFQRMTGVIRDEVRRLNGIIEEFLNFSRRDRLELKDYPVEDILQKLVSLIEEEARDKGILIERQWNSGRSLVPMDIDKLQQALLNLIKNGMESMVQQGSLTIRLERLEKTVAVSITDTGSGLTPEEIDRIFSPEYTTKEKGLGLGLPISHEIIRAHGGEIRVRSEVGRGSTFEITLPLSSV
jgi:signal transduction histidine kinase